MYRGSTKAGKVSNREMRRRAESAISSGARAVLVLVAVLAQSGGEVTITQGTLDQVTRELQDLDFGIFPGVAPGEFVVRLLVGGATPITSQQWDQIDAKMKEQGHGVTETDGHGDLHLGDEGADVAGGHGDGPVQAPDVAVVAV